LPVPHPYGGREALFFLGRHFVVLRFERWESFLKLVGNFFFEQRFGFCANIMAYAVVEALKEYESEDFGWYKGTLFVTFDLRLTLAHRKIRN